MASKWFVLGVAVAALGCAFPGGYLGDPCPTCPSSYSIEVDLRNATATDGVNLYARNEVYYCCGVPPGGLRQVYLAGVTIGAVERFRAEVNVQPVASVDCVVTRTEVTPVREVVFSGPPYQLTCLNW